MKAGKQTTIRERVAVSGVGVHSGSPVSLVLHPAEPDTGFIFQRSDIDSREVVAACSSVVATDLATVLGDGEGPLVSTAEHVLAALYGSGIDNCVIELDGSEVPILDGSAAPFVEAIEQAGRADLDAPRRFIKVLKPIRVAMGRGFAELLPAQRGFTVDVEIDFENPLIGRQRRVLALDSLSFRRDIARARTFGFMCDVAKLWGAGFALGASLDNTVVIADDRILNPEGLRYGDECVRHKILDAVGDLALAGAPIIGHYRSFCGGHKLNHAVLRALFADPMAWTLVEGRERRERGHADVSTVVPMPAYRAEVN